MNFNSKSLKNGLSKGRKQTRIINLKVFTLALFSILLLVSQNTFAHCDSYDGPVIKDATEALASNNVNLVLKWVGEADEPEITDFVQKNL